MGKDSLHRIFIGLVLLAACWLRLCDLAAKPMHADEANQAVKLGRMLEGGAYRFDPGEHHGPTLYYFALLPAWLRSEHSLASLRETTVRLTPAMFGIAAVLLLWLTARPLGRWPALMAAAFLAVSPPAVYYSRYFIQETLLMTFTLGVFVCGRRWWRSGHVGWSVGVGVCAGLMLATKASAPVFMLAAAFALTGAGRAEGPSATRERLRGLWPAVSAGALVWLLFQTSFGTNAGGLRDAFATFSPMWRKAAEGGGGHEKPWWYYGSLFVFQRNGGYYWDQTPFLILAVIGGFAAFRLPGRTVRFIAIYAAIVAVALSVVPYKTPWIVINLVPALCLLAALALSRLPRILALSLGLAILGLLVWQTEQAVFRRPADPRNPYAYVHSTPDVLKVPALAERAPAGPVNVIGAEYWPLPWYLRGRPQVGYWETPPADCDGALVIVDAGQVEAVRARLRGAYRESYLGLRPGFAVVVFETTGSPGRE